MRTSGLRNIIPFGETSEREDVSPIQAMLGEETKLTVDFVLQEMQEAGRLVKARLYTKFRRSFESVDPPKKRPFEDNQ